MLIEVYGPGCPKCDQSADVARALLAKRSIEGEVVKQTDLGVIAARGVLMTPAVFVDGVKLLAGRVLREKDLERFLADRAE
ncbi:MAG: thioredoxin family protein [Planctomycetota bacterium]|jgi:small redox-active disulfide protein 2